MTNNRLYLKYLNIGSFIVALYVNYLSVVTKLGGRSIRELSDKYDNLFTPSGQTFSIWGLIYTLIMIFLVVQFFKKYSPYAVTQNFLFSISCLLNAAWIIFWQFEFIGISVLVMLGLLTTLTLINKQISKEGTTLLKLIFGVYLGWICIATVANITTLFVAKELVPNTDLQQAITIGMLVIATALTGWLIHKLKNPYLFIPVSWAFYGIYTKRIDDYSLIAYTALTALAAIVVFALLKMNFGKKYSGL
jgi:hypothetical protein